MFLQALGYLAGSLNEIIYVHFRQYFRWGPSQNIVQNEHKWHHLDSPQDGSEPAKTIYIVLYFLFFTYLFCLGTGRFEAPHFKTEILFSE